VSQNLGINLNQIKAYFLRAMYRRYTSVLEPISSHERPGYSIVRDSEGRLSLVDSWCAKPSLNGNITIFLDGRLPVWFFNYNGEYPEKAWPYVQKALVTSYEFGKFWGGRGPRMLDLVDYGAVYFNEPVEVDFRKCRGYERIECPGYDLAGQLEYHGGSLL
jgi:hypothetical protein